MSSGTFELSVFVESISSKALQKPSFYTVILRAGSKQIQLLQKKGLSEQRMISLSQTLNLKLNQLQLQKSGYLAKLQVYSVQKYGRKNLEGECGFQVDQNKSREMRVQFTMGGDQTADLKFSYGLTKIGSRIWSQKSLFSNSSQRQSYRGSNKEIEIMLLAQLENKGKEVKGFQSQLTEAKEAAKEGLGHSQSVDQFQNEHSEETFGLFVNPSIRGLLKQKIDQDIQSINSKQESKKFQGQNLQKLSSLSTTNQQICFQCRYDLQLDSKIYEFSLINESQSQCRKQKKNKDSLSSSLSPSDLIDNLSFGDFPHLSRTHLSQKQNKTVLIRPKAKAECYEQWQNDDNLANIVHEMIDEVKGNLGYIKLSKISIMTKKITEIKNRNRFLSAANSQLIDNERFLNKKLEISQQVFKQKEQNFIKELNLIRNQIKQGEKKLLDMSILNNLHEKKLKQAQSKVQEYEKSIKELRQQVQCKLKQVKLLRQVLSSYEERYPPAVAKKDEIKEENNSHMRIFRRNPSTLIFNTQRKETLRKDKLSTERDKSQVQLNSSRLRPSEGELKGINPIFVEFFTSFRTKSSDVNEPSQNQVRGPVKRTCTFQKIENEVLISQVKESSLANRSSTFIEI